nr:hypothetical protein B0A51_10688 [Rachicladosporium sp. CCFEE 5018]
MLECRPCLLRYMRAVAGDAFPVQSRHLALTPHLSRRPTRRAVSTVAPERPRDVFDDVSSEPATPPSATPTALAPLQRPQTKSAIEISNQKALTIELRYLKDPVKLSEHVIYTLRNNQPDKALDLCRLASKTMPCVVSFNAIIDFYMRKLRVNDALKVYNEMKKRAQFPDSYTYIMLLRGLSLRSHVTLPVRQENVAKAIAIYTSMSTPSSRVKPRIIHTNAALNVCALANDLDAMWSIAAQIPEHGDGSADSVTYTIILNCIRGSAFGKDDFGTKTELHSAAPSLDQIAVTRQKAVSEGRRVWLDIIRKWRSGTIAIDEDLVGAMGRLLLISKSIQDWDSVLDLVAQTMKIERQVPSISDPDRNIQHVPQITDEESSHREEETDEAGFTASPAASAFKSVTSLQPSTPTRRAPSSLAYAKPGNQILSMLTEACQAMRTSKTATAYWNLLTSAPYNLKPDVMNFNAQLKLLAINRSSRAAAKLVSEDLPAAGLVPRISTFRIALRACQRDVKNSNVLEYATTIIDVMAKTCADPDPQTLTEYLSLALTTNDGEKIARVIDHLDPLVHTLRSRLNYGTDAPISGAADLRDRRDAVSFLRTLVGAIDVLLSRHLVPDSERAAYFSRRGDLSTFVSRCSERLERKTGRWESREGNKSADGLARRKSEVKGMSRAEWEKMKFKKRQDRTWEGRDGRVSGREERLNPGAVKPQVHPVAPRDVVGRWGKPEREVKGFGTERGNDDGERGFVDSASEL